MVSEVGLTLVTYHFESVVRYEGTFADLAGGLVLIIEMFLKVGVIIEGCPPVRTYGAGIVIIFQVLPQLFLFLEIGLGLANEAHSMILRSPTVGVERIATPKASSTGWTEPKGMVILEMAPIVL